MSHDLWAPSTVSFGNRGNSPIDRCNGRNWHCLRSGRPIRWLADRGRWRRSIAACNLPGGLGVFRNSGRPTAVFSLDGGVWIPQAGTALCGNTSDRLTRSRHPPPTTREGSGLLEPVSRLTRGLRLTHPLALWQAGILASRHSAHGYSSGPRFPRKVSLLAATPPTAFQGASRGCGVFWRVRSARPSERHNRTQPVALTPSQS